LKNGGAMLKGLKFAQRFNDANNASQLPGQRTFFGEIILWEDFEMKKAWTTLLSIMLTLVMVSSPVFAQTTVQGSAAAQSEQNVEVTNTEQTNGSEQTDSGGNEEAANNTVDGSGQATGETAEGSGQKEGQGAPDDITKGSGADNGASSGKISGEGKINGTIGLTQAFEHVTGTPAEKVISDLLQGEFNAEDLAAYFKQTADELGKELDREENEKVENAAKEELNQKREELKSYAKALREKMKTEKDAVKDKYKTFTNLADVFEQVGEVAEAADVQKEAVKSNVKNLEAYVKLGKLYEKLGKTGVKAFVNGEEPQFDVQPMIKDGRTLVPFRAIAEALKAKVLWNPEDRSVTVAKEDITVKLIVGSKIATVNGNEVALDVTAQIIENRLVVPLRFLGESLKTVVQWEPTTQSIVVYDEDEANSAE
jgi:tetratricopeptide (TPR) repeat protein